MNSFRYFSIARPFYAHCFVALLGSTALAAHGQTLPKYDAQACAALYQLSPTEVQMHEDATGQWWFSPQTESNSDANTEMAAAARHPAAASTLSLSPADTERFLGAKGDTVLVRGLSSSPDVPMDVRNNAYFIVRTRAPILDLQGKEIGAFTQLIAKARWDHRVDVSATANPNANNYEWVAPLRITQTLAEVDRFDRVIPRVCLNPLPVSSNLSDSSHLTAPTTQAHVLGFANAHSIGARSTMLVMDQGAAHGVRSNQSWALVDVLNPTTASSVTRTRGQVRIVQIFDTFTVVRSDASEREITRGSILKRTIERISTTSAP